MDDTWEPAEPEFEGSDVETLEVTDSPPKRKLNNLWNFLVHNKVDSSPKEIKSQKKESVEREKSEPMPNGPVPNQQGDDGPNERDEEKSRGEVEFDSENEKDIPLPVMDILNESLSQKSMKNNHINKTEHHITPVSNGESHNKDRDSAETDKIEKHNDTWTGLPPLSLQGDMNNPVADFQGTGILQGNKVTLGFLFTL